MCLWLKPYYPSQLIMKNKSTICSQFEHAVNIGMLNIDNDIQSLGFSSFTTSITMIIVIPLSLLSDSLRKLVKLSQQNLQFIVFSFHGKLHKPHLQLIWPTTDSLAYCAGEALGQFIALVGQGQEKCVHMQSPIHVLCQQL